MYRMFPALFFTALMATACEGEPQVCFETPQTRVPREGTNGSPGNNGLSALTFNELSYDLAKLSHESLYMDEGKKILSPEVTEFLESADGRKVFDYAIRCALPKGTSIQYGCNKVYQGEGILTTTAQWTSEGLDELDAGDLFSCIVAHLNPSGNHVPIFLSGPSVNDQNNGDGYPVEEALWITTETEVGIVYDVWPLFPWPEKCAADPLEALKKRVCGHDAETCLLEPHTTFTEDCTPVLDELGLDDGGHYECGGKPAIKTWLQSEEFLPSLYPSCYPQPM